MTAADLIAFEDRIRAHWQAGELPCLLHLCGGNEEQLLEIFSRIRPGDWILSTHRNHYHALLAGIPAEQLEADILAGHSMFTFSKEHNFLSSSVLAGTCAIAAGLAWTLKHAPEVALAGRPGTPPPRSPGREARDPAPHVYCFLGDGAEEEGHFYEAALFVESHGLPCTFIIEDNDRSVDSPRAARRPLLAATPHQVSPPRGASVMIVPMPLDHFRCVERYHYTPTYPHAGDGSAPGTITFKPAAIDRLRKVA